MKSGWEVKKLGEVCELITCGVAAKPKYVDKGIPFLSAKNVKEGKVIWSGYHCVSEQTHKQLTKNNKPVLGDILYTRVGSYGEAAVIEDNYEFSVFVSLTLIKVNKAILNNYFLKYYLNSNTVKNLAKKSISGSGVGNLNVGTVREFPIPLPPLSEQKRIVAILDKAFAVLEKTKENAGKNLQNARELFESYLQSVFTDSGDGWETEKMVEVCSIITCGVASTPKYVDERVGVPFLSAQNVKNGEVILDKYKFISREFHEKLTKNNKPTKGDILYSRVGAKYGEAGVVEHDFDFSVYVSLTLIRPIFEKLNNYFLKYYLNSPVIKLLAKKSIQSSGVPNLNVKDVREFPVIYPPLEKQHLIVKQIETLSGETKKLEAIYQKKLSNLEELKKSILQKAFNGELAGACS